MKNKYRDEEQKNPELIAEKDTGFEIKNIGLPDPGFEIKKNWLPDPGFEIKKNWLPDPGFSVNGNNRYGLSGQNNEDISQKKSPTNFYGGANMGPGVGGNDVTAVRYGNYNFDPETDYMALMIEAEKNGDYNAARYYENMRNAKIAAGFGGVYQPTNYYNYKSEYGDKINDLRSKLENYEDFNYTIEEDDNYKNLANVYHKNAMEAQKNALAQAAAANGGRLSSNAIIAASLGYGNQMNELEAEIPGLRQAAYNMHLNNKADIRNTMNDYISAEEQAYDRWNEDLNRRYGISRDEIADSKEDRNYNRSVFESDRAYERNVLNEDRYYNLDKANADATLEQMAKDSAVRESVLIGRVTEDAASKLGIPAGTPIWEAVVQIADLLGVVPDSIAKSLGFEAGGKTLAAKSLDDQIRVNTWQMNKTPGSVSYSSDGSSSKSGSSTGGGSSNKSGGTSTSGVSYSPGGGSSNKGGSSSSSGSSYSSAAADIISKNSGVYGTDFTKSVNEYAKKNGIDADKLTDEIAKQLGIKY